eukprot:1160977-Pelagomonas_calceolata.AAC.4
MHSTMVCTFPCRIHTLALPQSAIWPPGISVCPCSAAVVGRLARTSPPWGTTMYGAQLCYPCLPFPFETAGLPTPHAPWGTTMYGACPHLMLLEACPHLCSLGLACTCAPWGSPAPHTLWGSGLKGRPGTTGEGPMVGASPSGVRTSSALQDGGVFGSGASGDSAWSAAGRWVPCARVSWCSSDMDDSGHLHLAREVLQASGFFVRAR